MFPIDGNCSCQSFIDKALCWIAVWVFLAKPSDFKAWMPLDKPHNLVSFMVFCVIYKKDYALDGVSFGISNKVA